MARPNPVLNTFMKYLRSEFPEQGNLDLSNVLDENLSRVKFTYLEVKEAMLKFKTVDPDLHRLLAYFWQSTRSRNAIAEALHFDPSTVKRRANKAMGIILNYLVNSEVTADLEPIDIYWIEAKKNGTLANA
jgi:hypothetical protein